MSVAVIDTISRLVLDQRPVPRSLLIAVALVSLAGAALAIRDGLLASLIIVGGLFGAAVVAFLFTRPTLTLFIARFFRELRYNDPEIGLTHIVQLIANGAFLLATCAWILDAYSKRRSIVWNDVFVYMGAFVFWSAITLFWAGDFDVGFENLRRYGVGMITVFLLVQQVRTLENLDALMRLLAVLGWTLVILGFEAFFFKDFQFGDRLKVPGINENEFGSMLILFLPGALWPVMRTSGREKIVSLILAVLYVLFMAILVLLSGSRGSTLSLALTLAALCLWKPLRVWGLVGGTAALFLLVTSAPFLLDSLNKRFEGADNELGKRDVLWDGSLRLIADYPSTGVGVGNGALEVPHYAGITLVNRSDMPPHNILFEVTIETGLIGLLLYLAIFASAFYQLLVSRAHMQRGEAGVSLMPSGYFPTVLATAAGYVVALLKDGGANQPGVFLLIALLIVPSEFVQSGRS